MCEHVARIVHIAGGLGAVEVLGGLDIAGFAVVEREVAVAIEAGVDTLEVAFHHLGLDGDRAQGHDTESCALGNVAAVDF